MTDISIEDINESSIKLHFNNDGIRQELSDRYTFEAKNAKFHPSYKKRYWDGKLRLLKANNTTLAGLKKNIENFAKENNYTIDGNLFESQSFSLEEGKKFVESFNLPFKVDEWQIKAITLAIRNNRCVLISPTASGKSLIAFLLAQYYNVKTLICVPTIGLVEQMIKNFEEYGYKGEIHGVIAGVTKSTNLDITVSTWQSIYEQPKNFFKDFKLVIGDEAHNFKAKSLSTIMNKLTNAPYRIGMTGTLDGAEVNELTLEGLFGPIHHIVKSKTLMDVGRIAKLNPIQILVLKHPKEITKNIEKTYQDEMNYIVSCDQRNKFIRNLALSLKGNTLILFSYVEKHGKILFDLINSKTNNAHFVSGEVEAKVREEVRHYTEKSDNSIIVASYGVFSTGVNIKRIHNVIFASPTKSRIRTLQSIGRGLRIGYDKTECNLFDIADDLNYTNKKNFTLNHMIERVKMYSIEGFPYELHTIKLKGSTSGIGNKLF